jgi:predicted nucleotidyltransferase
MKTFSQIRESIIDIPRSTYAPMVFDSADTSNPKIKQSVMDMLDKQMKEFEKEYPILKYTLIGSILTKRYRNDADLDINILFDIPEEDREEERTRLSKQYLSASNPDNIQGKLIPGTKHPVNYYFITDKKSYDEQNLKADAAFDIKTNRFIKRPDDFTFDINLYLKDFQKKVDEIDGIKGELKRDIIDYDELSELKPGEIKDLEKRIKGKLNEIETDLQDLINIGDNVDVERRAAFDKDMTPDEIKTFSIKNRLPKNVVYKMLEKYHYLTFLKKCKSILDDGEVTDAEIDSLRKEHAQSKTRAVEEALDKGNKLIFAFGRFNPPTIGHGKLMSKVITEAKKNNANHIVYASASTDKRSNPLDVKTKVKFMKKMFPDNKIMAAGGTQRTFIEVLKFYDKMYGEIVMIAGSDRVSEFQKLTDKYNGKEYNYKSIKVVSSGERDPDAEGVAGMSASKMRDMAKNGDARSFKKGVPNLSDSDSSSLFNAVRKGMGITGRNYPLIKNSFTEFLNNDLREEYHQEKIFNVGDMIEHLDGTSGMVVRRGSNYVSYENEGLVKKAWLYDIQMSEEPRIPRKKGQPAGSDKHSDLYTDENPKGTIKGLGFKDPETARASVSKIKSSGKTHAHKIQAAVAMEQRAKEMGKSAEAAIYRRFIDKMKEKTKEMNKENILDTLEKEMKNLDEYYEIGTDEYAKHTMAMTPGQPIQNFRQHSKTIEENDIDKFANEDETIDKYKKRYGERWKDELEKAVLRMKKEL